MLYWDIIFCSKFCFPNHGWVTFTGTSSALNRGSASWQLPLSLWNKQPAVAAHGDFTVLWDAHRPQSSPHLKHHGRQGTTSLGAQFELLAAHPRYHKAHNCYPVMSLHQSLRGLVMCCWWCGKLGTSASPWEGPSAETQRWAVAEDRAFVLAVSSCSIK